MVRIVCISDTHGYHRKLDLPEGDILVHAGDFSRGRGSIDQVADFNDWLGELPYDHIVITSGNHDFPLERDLPLCRGMLTNCHLLMGEEVIIDGLKFYGDPHQPWFHNWAFNLPRGEKLAAVWANIPDDTDVLITHGPPKGVLDHTYWDNENVGCEALAERVIQVCPKVHVFGHIHEARGHINFGGIDFINASTCTLQYQPINKPYVVTIENGQVASVKDASS